MYDTYTHDIYPLMVRYVYVIIATTSIEIHVSARRNFEIYRDMLRPSQSSKLYFTGLHETIINHSY